MRNLAIQSKYDVIVCGAGPAGSTAALALSKFGRKVLLIDKDSFPREKSCGDFVSARGIDLLCQLGLRDKIQLAAGKGDFYRIEKNRIITCGQKVFELNVATQDEVVQNYIAPRFYFDAMIRQEALENGVEFLRANVKGPVLEKGKTIGINVQSSDGSLDVYSKIIIASDGVASTLRRFFCSSRDCFEDRHRGVAVRAYLTGIDVVDRTIEMFFYKEFFPGYAWIFPLNNRTVNVGVGIRLDYVKKNKIRPTDLMNKFIGHPTIRRRLHSQWTVTEPLSWMLNLGSQQNVKILYDNVMLTGDAAGFVDPFTGGGIDLAILSAKFAAEAAHQSLEKKSQDFSVLEKYPKNCNQYITRDFRFAYYKQIVMFSFPWLMDWFGLGKNWRRIEA